MKVTVDRKPHCVAVITGVLAATDVRAEFQKSLDRLVREVALPGFRKGKAPVERVLQEVGEKSVWQSAAEDALRDVLGDILKDNKIIPILPPTITLTAANVDHDVPYTVSIVTPPTAEIKDYKSVATEALKKLEKLDEVKEKGNARASLDKQVRTMLGKTEDNLPSIALAEEGDVKKLGFENDAALEFFLNTEADKAVENYDSQRKRGAVAEALMQAATVGIPEVMIAEEARAMLESSKQEIARQGLPFNEYLTKRGMTEAEVMTEMLPTAEKRASLDLVFAKIAEEEKLKPDDAETHRIAHALMHQGAPEDRAHQYGAEVSIREQVWIALGVAESKPKTETVEPESTSHDHGH